MKYFIAIAQFLLLGATIPAVFLVQPLTQATELEQPSQLTSGTELATGSMNFAVPSRASNAEAGVAQENQVVRSEGTATDNVADADPVADTANVNTSANNGSISVKVTPTATTEFTNSSTFTPGTVSTSATDLLPQSLAPQVSQSSQASAAQAQAVPTPVIANPRISLRGRSYVGAGVNIGVAGDTAIGNTSFAAFSKVAVTNDFSVRPAIFVSNNVTFLIPVTYDFPVVSAGAIHFNPFVGAGISISTRNEAVDFLVTGGVDFPITDRLTATAAANFGPVGGLDVGLVFGLAYTFGR